MTTKLKYIVILSILISVSACRDKKANKNTYSRISSDNIEKNMNIEMTYTITGSYSDYKSLTLAITAGGAAELAAEFYSDSPNPLASMGIYRTKLKLSDTDFNELIILHDKCNFFETVIVDLNKDKITVTDTGVTRLSYRNGGQFRELSFGFTEDKGINELLSFYRKIIDSKLPA